jgi:uncharacterized protein (UPF0276 family)
VIGEVWAMYARAHQLSGGRSTLLEWDDNIPDFDVVHAEVLKARDLVERRPEPVTEPEAIEVADAATA